MAKTAPLFDTAKVSFRLPVHNIADQMIGIVDELADHVREHKDHAVPGPQEPPTLELLLVVGGAGPGADSNCIDALPFFDLIFRKNRQGTLFQIDHLERIVLAAPLGDIELPAQQRVEQADRNIDGNKHECSQPSTPQIGDEGDARDYMEQEAACHHNRERTGADIPVGIEAQEREEEGEPSCQDDPNPCPFGKTERGVVGWAARLGHEKSSFV
mgnify:CR=1 FL=1